MESDLEPNLNTAELERVPGANVPPRYDIPKNDYAWLDTIDEDNCFMPLSLDDSRPSKTLDFGEDGCTGSLSTWHELLQLTGPDSRCGLVFVRGDFPDNPDAILARAQRRNQKGTFGMTIRVPTDDRKSIIWTQEITAAQGLVNARWPYTRLDWVKESTSTGSETFATFVVCSFVRQGTLYQIARIVPKKIAQPSPAPSSEDLGKESKPNVSKHHNLPIMFTVDVGGLIRFGCPSTTAGAARDPDAPLFPDDYMVDPPNFDKEAKVFTCTSRTHRKTLQIKLWVNRKLQTLRRHECKSARLDRGPNEVASLHIRQDFEFNDRETKVIVASFRLVNDIPESEEAPFVDYKQVMDHLGVSDLSFRAPYRLWTALLSSSSSADCFEPNAIARGVESALSVAALPLTDVQNEKVGARRADDNAESKSVTSTLYPNSKIALLNNIITPQIVDLESAFWQVRLLIRAYAKLEPEIQWDSQCTIPDSMQIVLQTMRSRCRRRIIWVIRGFVLWVLDLFGTVQKFDKPSELRDPGVGLLPSDATPDHDTTERMCKSANTNWRIGQQKYYGSMIVWYVMSQLPEAFDNPRDNSLVARDLLRDNLLYFGNVQTTPDHPLPMDDPYGCIVRWYHNFALLQLCRRLHEGESVKLDDNFIARLYAGLSKYDQRPLAPDGTKKPQQLEDDPTFDLLITKLSKRVNKWQTNGEKAMRLFEQGRLRDHELGHETAILAKVGEEMGIPQRAITVRGVTCLQLSKTLFKRRGPTKKLKAGRSHILRWDPLHDIRSAKPRPAPWELSCLAQQTPYILDLDTCGNDKCQKRCMDFMFSDYSFMGSWDASKTSTIGQWWDFVTTNIVVTKLLEESSRAPAGEAANLCQDTETRLLADGVDALHKIHDLYHRTNEQANPVFPWKTMEPKKIYHLDSSVRSVEDTPDLDKIVHRPGNGKLGLRLNLKRYFKFNGLPGAALPLKTIGGNIGASKLHNISCLDILLATENNERPETSHPIVRGRADKAFWDGWAREDKDRTDLFNLFNHKRGAGLQDMYLIGKASKHPFYKKNKKLLESDMRKDLLKDYQRRLFFRLNDSLVDQGVKYRVIFTKRYSPVTMQAMVYMWHPDAIDTFDDHLGELSTFRDTTDQSVTGTDNTWISSITIKHWRLLGETETMIRKAEKKVDEDERQARINIDGNKNRCPLLKLKRKPRAAPPEEDEGENAAKAVQELDKDRDFPPPSVRDDRQSSAFLLWWNIHELNKIHELSLSLAITGDAMGRSWTCSIICELFTENDMKEYTEEASGILQMFIHQQNSARCLVFLMFLGYMCLALAKECDSFMYELDGVMRLDSKVLLNGMEWEKSDRALKKLKQMLWGYESLRSFRDMLRKAIEQVDKARARMTKLLENGASIRHEDMKRAELQIKDEFEKKYSRLEAAHQAVEQRVEQGYKLREGITSVLGVEQNENISMLTWLTIIYLGPAFVVGLFGMNTNPILPDLSSTTFYRLFGGLLGGTILFALCLSTVIAIIRFIWRQLTKPIKHVWEIGHQQARKKGTYWWKHRHDLIPLLSDESEKVKKGKKTEEDVESGVSSTWQGVESNGSVVVGKMQ